MISKQYYWAFSTWHLLATMTRKTPGLLVSVIYVVYTIIGSQKLNGKEKTLRVLIWHQSNDHVMKIAYPRATAQSLSFGPDIK